MNWLLKIEETLWRQRSRVVWLMNGDKNTKFFHFKADQRRRINQIKRLKNEEGVWKRGWYNCERILINYFKEIFSSAYYGNINQVCKFTRGWLSDSDKQLCDSQFSAEEVCATIFDIHPHKSPGPDGLPALFYQRYWSIVGNEMEHFVLDILNNNRDPAAINNALIPKKKHPSNPRYFRPISLCNVIMKAVTKSIANRLKTILPSIISEEQSAFIRGRLNTDNALIAMEWFHWLKHKKMQTRDNGSEFWQV